MTTVPRPNRAHGRPGTRVIPTSFEADHARVIDKTLDNATVTIRRPLLASGVTIGADLTPTVTNAAPVHTDLPARVQELSANESRVVVGDQEQILATHLVVLQRDIAGIPDRSTVHIDTSTDPDLAGLTLTVRRPATGSMRFERDLYCVLDLTDIAEE